MKFYSTLASASLAGLLMMSGPNLAQAQAIWYPVYPAPVVVPVVPVVPTETIEPAPGVRYYYTPVAPTQPLPAKNNSNAQQSVIERYYVVADPNKESKPRIRALPPQSSTDTRDTTGTQTVARPRVIVREYLYLQPTKDTLPGPNPGTGGASDSNDVPKLKPTDEDDPPKLKVPPPADEMQDPKKNPKITDTPTKHEAVDNKVTRTGRFVNGQSGGPMADMQLVFVSYDGRQPEQKTTTNQQGAFSITLLPGQWFVFLQHPKGEGRRYLDTVTISDSDTTQLSIEN